MSDKIPIIPNSTKIPVWKNTLYSSIYILDCVSPRTKSHIAVSLQTFWIIEIYFQRWLKGKKEIFWFYYKNRGRITAFPIKLNGTAGKVFQARETMWRNGSLIRVSSDKSVIQGSLVQLPGLVKQMETPLDLK